MKEQLNLPEKFTKDNSIEFLLSKPFPYVYDNKKVYIVMSKTLFGSIDLFIPKESLLRFIESRGVIYSLNTEYSLDLKLDSVGMNVHLVDISDSGVNINKHSGDDYILIKDVKVYTVDVTGMYPMYEGKYQEDLLNYSYKGETSW